MRYELNDYEWAAIRPMLPNKPRGVPGLDPGIHEAIRQQTVLRLVRATSHHRLPGQARQ